jgi:hypothetical protein
VAKNAWRTDVGLTNLAAAVERLSQAVAMLAADPQAAGAPEDPEAAAAGRASEEPTGEPDEVLAG